MLGHIHGHVNRDGEGNAHEAAAAAVNLRVDADHLAAQVKQRAARIAGVDGDVGLNERRVVFVGQGAVFGRHDACGNAVVETEGRTDGGHPFAGFQLARIAQLGHGQIGGIDFQQGNVGFFVCADEFGRVFALVVQRDFDVVHVFDDVGVGQDIAVFADNHAGTEIGFVIAVQSVRIIGDDAFEKIGKGIDVGTFLCAAFAAGVPQCLNIDHRTAFSRHQLGEIRQQHAHGAVRLRCFGLAHKFLRGGRLGNFRAWGGFFGLWFAGGKCGQQGA